MTAKRPAGGAPKEGEAALSSVLGAVLLFGLLVSTLVTVQVQYVPVWDHQREARLMDSMAGQLAQLKSDLERQATNRSNAATTVPVTLGPDGGFALFTGSTQPGSLAFRPAAPGTGLTVASNQLTILHKDDVDLFVLNEDWRPVSLSTPVSGIGGVDHLRIRIAEPATLGSREAIRLILRDSSNAVAGSIVIQNEDQGPEYSLLVQTFAGAQTTTPLTSRMDSWWKTFNDDFYFDALEPGFGFDALLETTPGAKSLQWAAMAPHPLMQGVDMALVYTSPTAGRVGAAGVVVSGYTHAADGGRLVAGRDNQQFPGQTYTLEYGALIVDQSEGAAMLAPPAFNVRTAAGQTAVSWTLPELTGSGGEVGGTRAAQVASTPLGPRMTLQGTAPSLTFTLATEHAAVWKTYWDRVLGDAGLSPACTQPLPDCNPQYKVETTPTSATLRLFGHTPAPADTAVNDLYLTYQEANLALSLLPSGG